MEKIHLVNPVTEAYTSCGLKTTGRPIEDYYSGIFTNDPNEVTCQNCKRTFYFEIAVDEKERMQ